jgi:hypothetical protein
VLAHPVCERRKVVVVAEPVGELVRLVTDRLHHRRPQFAQQGVLIPEVLHAFAPLVERLDGRGALSRPEVPASVAVCALEPLAQRIERVALQWPILDTLARLAQHRDHPGGGCAARVAAVPGAVTPNRRAQLGLHPGGNVERLEGVQHHVALAHVRQLAAGIPEAEVLAAERGVAELTARHAEQGAQLLQVLARLVHRLLRRAVRLSAQLLERVADAAIRNADDALWKRLRGLQAICPLDAHRLRLPRNGYGSRSSSLAAALAGSSRRATTSSSSSWTSGSSRT